MREIQGYQKKDETLETTLRNLSRFFSRNLVSPVQQVGTLSPRSSK